jgi:hypothetical protein
VVLIRAAAVVATQLAAAGQLVVVAQLVVAAVLIISQISINFTKSGCIEKRYNNYLNYPPHLLFIISKSHYSLK